MQRRIERIEYKWIIHEFSSLDINVGGYLESPEIYGRNKNFKCSLQLWSNEETGYLSTFVKIVPLETTNVPASFSVSILGEDGNKKFILYTTQFYDFYENLTWGFDDVMSIYELLKFLNKGMLSLLFDINVLHLSYTEKNGKCIENTMKVISPELSQRKADILFSVDGMLFYAHRDILASRSDYFKTVIKELNKQDSDGIFHLSGIDCNLFSILIQYMYTGKFDDVEKYVKDILKFADKYDIAELKKYCEDTLIKTMNVDNVVELLSMAEQYRANILRNYALQFIIYKAKEIFKSQAWNYFAGKPYFASLIRGAVASNKEK